MSIEVGEAVIQFLADTKQLDAQLAKIQRAIQAMRDVLNEKEPDITPPDSLWPKQ
jgi:hypothetical protein